MLHQERLDTAKAHFDEIEGYCDAMDEVNRSHGETQGSGSPSPTGEPQICGGIAIGVGELVHKEAHFSDKSTCEIKDALFLSRVSAKSRNVRQRSHAERRP